MEPNFHHKKFTLTTFQSLSDFIRSVSAIDTKQRQWRCRLQNGEYSLKWQPPTHPTIKKKKKKKKKTKQQQQQLICNENQGLTHSIQLCLFQIDTDTFDEYVTPDLLGDDSFDDLQLNIDRDIIKPMEVVHFLFQYVLFLFKHRQHLQRLNCSFSYSQQNQDETADVPLPPADFTSDTDEAPDNDKKANQKAEEKKIYTVIDFKFLLDNAKQ